LNHSLFFIEFEGKEIEPDCKIRGCIENSEVSLDDFTHGSDSIISTMTVSFLFFTAFRNLYSLQKGIEPELKSFSIKYVARSSLSEDSQAITSSLPENTA
jgi:hypothetical protein